MEEHIATFQHCCAALLTGVNVVEANSWLIALADNASIGLPLCLAVIAAADARKTHSVFLAAKIIHQLLRKNHHTNTLDVECLQVSLLGITTTVQCTELINVNAHCLITGTDERSVLQWIESDNRK